MKKIGVFAACTVAVFLLVACGSRSSKKASDKGYVVELDPKYNIETETLLQKFPITYQTPAVSDWEKGIQNRMLNGFNCWNEGFDSWKAWGDVLYSPESIYNVNGVRLTLEEYRQSMNVTLARTDIQMGDFENMIISDDWTAIRYATTHRNMQTGEVSDVPVTEFVHFKDFGEKGMKVDEGWGGTKGSSYSGIMNFQTEEEKERQVKMMQEIMDTVVPETSDLEEKYPVLYPTRIEGEMAKKMKMALLSDIDNWNKGYEAWEKWTDSFYTADVLYNYNGKEMDLAGLKLNGKAMFSEKDIKRVKIYNIIISDDWAAVHAWSVVTAKDGTKDVFDNMSFFHFVNDSDGVKVDKCWIKESV